MKPAVTLRWLLLGTLAVLALGAGPRPVAADDVGVTSARLLELEDGGYALEADVSPALLPVFGPPVVPERFSATRPTYRRLGVDLVVRYEFGGTDVPLQPGDVLLLPWGRSAVLLTARWTDGTVQRGMFPRSPAGIRVPVEALRPVERSALSVARQHLGAGLQGIGSLVLRLLLALGLLAATVGGATGRAVRLALVFACGHALALVALDLGVPTLPPALGSALVALGVAVLARVGLRGGGIPLWPLVLTVGLVDGLGLAGGLAPRLGPSELVPALFGAALGLDALLLLTALALGLLMARAPGTHPALARGARVALGSFAVAVLIVTVASGLRAAGNGGVDPADHMAAARFDFGAGGGGGSGGGRAAAAPRRLESAAMLFLTVEPNEVRLEVLLGLRDFLEPLRIDGGAGSVVPVAVQDAIAERARNMVAETVGVVIDGREAVPLLTLTDFVTVAATGVSTRREPQPERLATAVLGVTLAYGVDRPPSEITAGWRVFPTAATVVPAVWTDPTGSERVELTSEEATLHWANDLSSFETPPVSAVEVKPARWPLASLLLATLAALVWLVPLRWRRRRLAWGLLAVAIVLYPFARHAVALPGLGGWAPARAETAEVLDDLLTGVYRSFDLRDEEAIYDRLAVSVDGEQLSEVYLENRRALELENRGGARARVDEVEVLEVRSVRRDGQGGFRVDASWTVSGSVNHFGHVHYRQNRYDAAVHVVEVEGAWKIGEIEILDERRLL